VLDSDSGLEDFLIQRGATVDAHAAARLGRMDRLEELLDTDPTQVHARGGDGQTPLHFARNIAIAELLLARGADLDARDIDHESTAAQYMVRDRQDVARYLVQRGCRTDLLMASALGDIETVRRHLEADPECIRMNVSEDWFPKQDPRAGGSIYIWTLGPNKTAHAVAREFGHTEIFQLLLERSPADLKLGLACEYGNDALCRELLSADSDLARKLPHSERRRLVDAAQANNSAAVKRMLEAGWPLDGRGQHGATALHWAAFHGNAVMVRELIAGGAPLEMKDAQYDGTPLGWAKHGSGNSWHRQTGDYEQVIRLLSN
jgi:ankyrin repeat protein